MDDLISRQAAIDAIGKLSDEIYRTVEKGATFPTQAWFDGMAQAEHIVKNLPSAHPEQKKGEWINRSLNILYPAFERYTCSVCGKHSYSYDFCPNCGSYNGGENNDKG